MNETTIEQNEKEFLFQWLKAASLKGKEYYCKLCIDGNMYLESSTCILTLQSFISDTIITLKEFNKVNSHDIRIEISRIGTKLSLMLSEAPILTRRYPEQF
jgi:hypothetical protein